MRQTNSPVVSVMGWARHLDHYLYQQYLEAAAPGLKLPVSCRGIPHSIERVKFDPPPAGWFPSDDQMIVAISHGIQRAVALLQGCGVKTDLTTRTGFFKQPCKHFPKTDSYVKAGGLLASADKEDDPNGPSPDGEEVDLTVVEAQDAADVEAVLGNLFATAANVEVTAGSEKTTAAFFEEVHRLLANFNVALQEESKDRKYRFVVKRLMKAHQRQGDDVDEELDFYRDDDDVAVLFTMGDGSVAFALGNIEEVAVASGTVDARRALGGTGSEYLRNLEKVYRPNGVHIDDPKGLVISRWYREVKADGSPVDQTQRYQNPQCKAYQLTLDNDGAPFVWTSNYQIITKVILKKHSSLPRTYTLNNKDSSMVNRAMKKMVTPEVTGSG